MRRAPLVGVTTSLTFGKDPERAYLNTAYLRAVQAAGAIPVPLVPQLDADARAALLSRLSALVLTGGGDVDPALYGESRHPTVEEVSPERDALEIEATRWALDEGIPLLAICRGIQVVNVALGGTLYQDIATAPGSPIAHSQKESRDRATHPVRVEPDSRLAEVLGASALDVNSLHHQAVKAPGDRVRVVAWSPDGIVEGAELTTHPFFVAVQWHPEELVTHDAAARSLFAALVDAAARRPTLA